MSKKNDFNELKNVITADLNGTDIQTPHDDSYIKNIRVDIGENAQYSHRNQLYSSLLEKYITIYEKKEKAKAWYKGIFFAVTIILFVVIVVGCLYSILLLQHGNASDVTNVSVAIANIAGIISTIIILPKIIADHLFPTNEENNMLNMVEKMQSNDASIRDLLHKELIENDKTKDTN